MPVDIAALVRVWHQHNLLFYSVVCFVCSCLSFTEVFEKIFSGSQTMWSPLLVFGPAVWLPLSTDQGYLIAAQAMILGTMYCMACCCLFYAQYEGRKNLIAPWLLMHSFVVAYQIISIIFFVKNYKSSDIALASSTIFVNLLLLWSSYVSIAYLAADNARRLM